MEQSSALCFTPGAFPFPCAIIPKENSSIKQEQAGVKPCNSSRGAGLGSFWNSSSRMSVMTLCFFSNSVAGSFILLIALSRVEMRRGSFFFNCCSLTFQPGKGSKCRWSWCHQWVMSHFTLYPKEGNKFLASVFLSRQNGKHVCMTVLLFQLG